MSRPKRIGVVGGGPAGLCVGRHFDSAEYNVIIYEQQSDVGGTWVYSPEINGVSSLYETMYTNIPKEVMAFDDLPIKTESSRSFIHHTEMLSYLRQYAEPIMHMLRLNTKVVNIERIGDEWEISTVKINENETEVVKERFDVVFVCNGHYTTPRIPDFANRLKIPWIHCHNYRRSQEYKNKVVAIVGAGPSGVDVGIQIGLMAKKVYLLHNQKLKFGLPNNVINSSRAVEVSADGKGLMLEDGTELNDLDAVLFCTGYRYDLPFLDKNLVHTEYDDSYVSQMYEHFVHVKYPTSFFLIGLNFNLIPFILFDCQINYAKALIEGTTPVPSEEELTNFEKEQLRTLKENDISDNFFHQMGSKQWGQFDKLRKLANLPPYPPVLRRLYDHVHENRLANLSTFKSYRYRIIDSEHFEFEAEADQDCN